MRKSVYLYALIAFLFSAESFMVAQVEVPNSTDSLYKARIHATGKELANINLQIARYYHWKNNDSLYYYVSLLEDYLETNKDMRVEAFVKKFRSYEADQNLDIDLSIKFAEESLELFQELNDYREIGWLYNSIGREYFRLGDLASATEQHLLALENFTAISYQPGIAVAYNSLGRISFRSEHYDKAKEYFENSLETYNEMENNDKVYQTYNNLALLHLKNKDTTEALSNFLIAARGFQKLEDERRLALVYGNISRCYDSKETRVTAISYARKALKHSTNAGDRFGIITGNINLGYFLRLKGEKDSSLYCLQTAEKMALKRKVLGLQENVYQEYEYFYVDQEDYRKAYFYRLKYDSISKTIIDAETQQKIEELNFNYNHKLEEREIIRLKAHQKAQSRINKILFLVLIGILILGSILGYLFLLNRKRKNELTYKNNLLNNYNEKLENSEKVLKVMIEDKNKLFSIIAHDLRNPIAAVKGFTELLDENFEELDNASRKEYINHIFQGSIRAMSLLENLLLWARSQMDLIDRKPEDVSVSNLINESANHLMTSIEQKNLELDINISEDFTIHVDQEMIKAVIRNLLSNAIKFSYPENKVHINALEKDEMYYIEIIDHGTGMEKSKTEDLFSSSNINTTVGTQKETGSGLGLMISKDFTEKNGGVIKVSSTPGQGSTFSICFPKTV